MSGREIEATYFNSTEPGGVDSTVIGSANEKQIKRSQLNALR